MRRLRILFLRWAPKRRRLAGGMLHKILGDRLFDKNLWQLSLEPVARGFAVGAFISMIPIPIQMLVASFCAFFFRVNIPSAIMACWITNPVTMPIIFPLQYKLGSWVITSLGFPDVNRFHQITPETKSILEKLSLTNTGQFFDNTMRKVMNLSVGSLIFSVVASLLVYGLFQLLFRYLKLHREKVIQKKELQKAVAED